MDYQENLIAQMDKDKPGWWVDMASDQQLGEYARATDSATRERCKRNMKATAFVTLHYAINAALTIGAVVDPATRMLD